MRDPRHAPEHLVRQLAATFPPRRDPRLGPDRQAEAHLTQCRMLADAAWMEAFAAGMAFAMARSPAVYAYVLTPEQAAVVESNWKACLSDPQGTAAKLAG